MPAFWVKLGTNDLNCVDVLLNPTHSLTLFSCDVHVFVYKLSVLILCACSRKNVYLPTDYHSVV